MGLLGSAGVYKMLSSHPSMRNKTVMEYDVISLLLLVAVGVLSGFINTLAGGGSMLVLPAMLFLGMPADIANATIRVGIFVQSMAGMKGFHSRGHLDSSAIIPILIPAIPGALLGALLASWLPLWILKPTLLSAMIIMALAILIKPEAVISSVGSMPHPLRDRPLAVLSLFMAGVYGGFVQAGVGFILIAALAAGLGYDLLRTHALKTVCTAVFSAVALGIFAWRDQVWWLPGIMLAIGSVIGAMGGVRFAIKVDQSRLKWILFIMVTLTCLGAYWSD